MFFSNERAEDPQSHIDDKQSGVETAQGTIDISGIKRCYVELVITAECPTCSKLLAHDFKHNCLNYPKVGGDDSLYFYCDACNTELEMPIKIASANMVIEYDPENITVV